MIDFNIVPACPPVEQWEFVKGMFTGVGLLVTGWALGRVQYWRHRYAKNSRSTS